MDYASKNINHLWLKTQLAAPLNMSPVDLFVVEFIKQAEQILDNSYCGPIIECQEAIELAKQQLREWALHG